MPAMAMKESSSKFYLTSRDKQFRMYMYFIFAPTLTASAIKLSAFLKKEGLVRVI